MKILLETTRYRKDFRRAMMRSLDIGKLQKVIQDLRQDNALPLSLRPHKLQGKWEDFMEYHIEPDWLLIYQITETQVILVRTGTHADLFE